MEFLEHPHLSVADLEKRWKGKVSRKTLYQWAKSGRLPPRHCIGSVKFWTLEQIERWESEHIHPAGSASQKPVSSSSLASA